MSVWEVEQGLYGGEWKIEAGSLIFDPQVSFLRTAPAAGSAVTRPSSATGHWELDATLPDDFGTGGPETLTTTLVVRFEDHQTPCMVVSMSTFWSGLIPTSSLLVSVYEYPTPGSISLTGISSHPLSPLVWSEGTLHLELDLDALGAYLVEVNGETFSGNFSAHPELWAALVGTRAGVIGDATTTRAPIQRVTAPTWSDDFDRSDRVLDGGWEWIPEQSDPWRIVDGVAVPPVPLAEAPLPVTDYLLRETEEAGIWRVKAQVADGALIGGVCRYTDARQCFFWGAYFLGGGIVALVVEHPDGSVFDVRGDVSASPGDDFVMEMSVEGAPGSRTWSVRCLVNDVEAPPTYSELMTPEEEALGTRAGLVSATDRWEYLTGEVTAAGVDEAVRVATWSRYGSNIFDPSASPQHVPGEDLTGLEDVATRQGNWDRSGAEEMPATSDVAGGSIYIPATDPINQPLPAPLMSTVVPEMP